MNEEERVRERKLERTIAIWREGGREIKKTRERTREGENASRWREEQKP